MGRTIYISDANAFQMPEKCVVCGAKVNALHHYTQDHLPLIGPGIGLIRTSQVAVPYCDEHLHAFRKRFRNLRVLQGIAYVLLLAILLTLVPEGRKALGWEGRANDVAYALGAAVFFVLVATIFCIKPFLYDAFITRSGNRLRIESSSEDFLQNVMAANQRILE